MACRSRRKRKRRFSCRKNAEKKKKKDSPEFAGLKRKE
jgi:hypothetical protein